MGTFAAEDIHIPSVYVNRIVKGGSYEKRIEVKNEISRVQLHSVLTDMMDNSLNSIQTLPFPLMNSRVSPCFQKRTVKKSQQAQPKPKKDSDVVRERIIRRAALEFQDGMYGILFKEKTSTKSNRHHPPPPDIPKQAKTDRRDVHCLVLIST